MPAMTAPQEAAATPGWHTLPLTPLTLALILAVQSCAQHARDLASLQDQAGLLPPDWQHVVERFFSTLPAACLPDGFTKNEDTFRCLLEFTASDEMRRTPYAELGAKFSIRKWVMR
jgi:hypothetical protein